MLKKLQKLCQRIANECHQLQIKECEDFHTKDFSQVCGNSKDVISFEDLLFHNRYSLSYWIQKYARKNKAVKHAFQFAINCTNRYGQTTLHLAATQGDTLLASDILKNDGAVDIKDNKGFYFYFLYVFYHGMKRIVVIPSTGALKILLQCVIKKETNKQKK